MAKSRKIEYSCYAYFVIDRPTNTYPIKDAKKHLESIYRLKKGDIISIKGLGNLVFDRRNVDNYDYVNKGIDGLYQEISLKCNIIH